MKMVFVINNTDAQDIITTVAGGKGDGGAATAATLNCPYGIISDSSGNIYIADKNNDCIRKITVSSGIISTIAGTGSQSYSGDGGAATNAKLYQPFGVGVDISGNVYIADSYNNAIRAIAVSTGIITTIAGTGIASYSGDGDVATSATLYNPSGVTVDSSGNVYIADYGNHRIRKVTILTGKIATIAGTGASSYSGDGGVATSAELNRPSGIALDFVGNTYIADSNNNRIRKVTVSTGIITTIAGTGTGGYSGDGGASTSAMIYFPTHVALDSAGI